MPPLFDFAPGGVYRAGPVTSAAVRFYRTVSTLPRRSNGGLFSVALSLRSPWPGITRHRSSLEPGLSSRMKIPSYRRPPNPLAGRALARLERLHNVAKALRPAEGSRTITQPLANSPGLTIVDYDPTLAKAFYDINAQWIESMFVLEPVDEETLSKPQEKILDPGGAILFVKSEQHGIVGACALKKTSDAVFELTKMGVLETARGLKAGEFLLAAVLERAKAMEIKTLYLLTSSKCEAAIHLYEKLGFYHSKDIMNAYGASYERCDVAMQYRG